MHKGQSRLLVSASEDQTLRLWDVESGHCLHVLTEQNGYALSVAFSPDGEFLASGSSDAVIRLWKMAAPEIEQCCFLARVLQNPLPTAATRS